MTMPQEVTRASEQLRDWLDDLKRRAMLGSPHASYAMLRAGLQEARDRLSVDDALRLADVVPPLVRGIMLEGWHPIEAPAVTRTSFLAGVKERLEPHHPPPDNIVHDVMVVLAQRTPPHLRSELGEHLPRALEPIWRAALDEVRER